MSMPQAVRHINEIRVLDMLFRQGAMSRADLGRGLGLTRSTAGNLVSRLAQLGFVRDGVATTRDEDTRTGRPGSLVELNRTHAFFIGAEIGIGRITVVAVDLHAKVVSRTEKAFDLGASHPAAIVEILAQCVEDIVRHIDSRRVRGLGIAVPGPLSPQGVVMRAPFLGWREAPLTTMVSARLPMYSPVLAENDANAFAMAELYHAGPEAPANAVYLLIDVGVGAGIVSSGVLVRGQRGFAGEIGHIPIGDPDQAVDAKLPGSLESFVGVEAVLARHRRSGGSAQTLTELVSLFAGGDKHARATVSSWADHLGRGLAVITAVLDPERIVLGGPGVALFTHSSDEAEQSLRSRLLDNHPIPSIAVSALGKDAPALGAALILHKQFLSFDLDLVFNGAPPREAADRGLTGQLAAFSAVL